MEYHMRGEQQLTDLVNVQKVQLILNHDFLKLDCEGSELDIIRSIEPNNFKNIKIIRMETHSKKIANEIIKLLKENSFIVEKNKNSIIWSKKI